MRRPALALIVTLAAAAALLACKHEPTRSAPAVGSQPGSGSGPAASADDPWAGKGVAAPVIARPMFWAASKDGHTTYLLGTIHLGINADTQLPPWVKARLDAAPTFAMEANLAEPGLMAALNRSDGGSLRLDLGPEHWAKLEAAVGADMAKGVDKMKPFAVMSLLEAKFLPTTLPMDSVLETRAKSAGKKIVYLESAMRQLEIIEPFMTAADVKAFLDHLDYARSQSGLMLDAYQRGDDVTLGKQFDDQTLWIAAGREPALFAGFVKALLADRNATWIPQIEAMTAAGGGFVAVGAGHLVGPGNVLAMLTERGFTITRATADTGAP